MTHHNFLLISIIGKVINHSYFFFHQQKQKMASITFAVSKVDVGTKQHTETQDLIESDLARWTAKDQKLSLENFQTNYSLFDELNGKNY